MARRRFFATTLAGDHARVEGANAAHLSRVLRAEPGQVYELAWEGRAYLARIERVRRDAVDFALVAPLPSPAPQAELEAGVALFKFDRFEWLLEKATELGLTRLWPLLSRRTDPHLAAAAAKRAGRWNQIALQAAEQSRRTALLRIEAPVGLEAFLALPGPQSRWLLDETPGGQTLAAVRPCRVLAGPEGGWAPEESAAAQAAGYVPVSLGPRILRCETAVLAALVLVSR